MQLLDPPLHAAIRAAGCQDYLFCFRWIMVSLKREFALSQVQTPRHRQCDCGCVTVVPGFNVCGC